MNKEEILTKAIEKAMENGFVEAEQFEICLDRRHFYMIRWEDDYYDGMYDLIFSHNFLKAFFKQEQEKADKLWDKIQSLETTPWEMMENKPLSWKDHAQIMIVEEDPITYLEKFI